MSESNVFPSPEDDLELPRKRAPKRNNPKTMAHAKSILSGVMAGLTLKDSCTRAGWSRDVFYEWMEKEPRLRQLYELACEHGSHAIAEKILDASFELMMGGRVVSEGDPRVKGTEYKVGDWYKFDKNEAYSVQCGINACFRMLQFRNRAYYGERVELNHAHSFSFSMDLSAANREPSVEDRLIKVEE